MQLSRIPDGSIADEQPMPHLPPLALRDWIPLLKEVRLMIRTHPLSNMGSQSRTLPGG